MSTDATHAPHPQRSTADRFSGDVSADSAAAWRRSLPEVTRGGLDDELIATVDRLPEPVRQRVLARWRSAVRAGVVDQTTLTVIADAVADAC